MCGQLYHTTKRTHASYHDKHITGSQIHLPNPYKERIQSLLKYNELEQEISCRKKMENSQILGN